MIKRCTLVGALVVIATVATSDARAGEADTPAFGPGEQATYSVNYLGIRAGTVQLTIGSRAQVWDKQVWPIVALIRTDPKLSIYPIKDRFVTYWETSRWRSIGSDFYADENRKRRHERMRLDHEARSITVHRQKEGEAQATNTQQMEPGSGDIAAAIFSLRSKPLAEGASVEIPVVTGHRSFTLRATVEGRQMLQTSVGVRDVYKLRVQTGFAGKFQSKGDLIAYVTADGAQVPVRIEAEFILGTVVAELTEYHPGNVLAARLPGGH